MQVRSLGWEDPLEKEMATHSSTLAWRIPWTKEPGRLQSIGSQRVGLSMHTPLRCRTYPLPLGHREVHTLIWKERWQSVLNPSSCDLRKSVYLINWIPQNAEDDFLKLRLPEPLACGLGHSPYQQADQLQFPKEISDLRQVCYSPTEVPAPKLGVSQRWLLRTGSLVPSREKCPTMWVRTRKVTPEQPRNPLDLEEGRDPAGVRSQTILLPKTDFLRIGANLE